MTKDISKLLSKKNCRVNVEQQVPVLPVKELRKFVEYYISRKSVYLDLLDQTPPPVYVLETHVLKKRSNQFQAAFRACLPDVGFYYAVKSNNHKDVARTLVQTGMGLDVSSGLELESALELGTRDVVFSGPGKTDTELQLAVQNSEHVAVLIDSFGELERLQKIALAYGKYVRVGVRLTTHPEGLWRKFGILPEQLNLFWDKVNSCTNLCFEGLQFHTSWNLGPTAQIDFIKLLGNVLSQLPSNALDRIRFIDIGGGYWPPQGEWLQAAGTPAGMVRKALAMDPGAPDEHYRMQAVPIEIFAEQVCSAIRKHIHPVTPCRICVEPGRWLCNDAMHLLLSVVDKKSNDLVVTDAGTNAVGWERFETDYFPVINLSRPALDEKNCNILGSLCTPHDVWGYNYWGEDIKVGDILLIPTQGAYTYSLRQHFIKPLPQVITL